MAMRQLILFSLIGSWVVTSPPVLAYVTSVSSPTFAMYTLDPTAGQATLTTSTDARSAVACASLCARRGLQCAGFEFKPVTRDCVLVANTTLRTANGGELFYTKDQRCPPLAGFFDVRVSNLTYCLASMDDLEVTFQQASNACLALGAFLVPLDARAKFKALHELMQAAGVARLRHWVGVTDLEFEGFYVNEVNGIPVDWDLLVWKNDTVQGDRNLTDCLAIHHSTTNPDGMGLNERRCSTTWPYICQAHRLDL